MFKYVIAMWDFQPWRRRKHRGSRRHLQHPERFVMAGVIGLALGAAVLVVLLFWAA